MSEPLTSSDLGNQKRRSTRIVQAVPITVTGVDALGQPFKERTTTVMVNCHGCKYQSKHYVPKNSIVKLEIPRPEAGCCRREELRVESCGCSGRAPFGNCSKLDSNLKSPATSGASHFRRTIGFRYLTRRPSPHQIRTGRRPRSCLAWPIPVSL